MNSEHWKIDLARHIRSAADHIPLAAITDPLILEARIQAAHRIGVPQVLNYILECVNSVDSHENRAIRMRFHQLSGRESTTYRKAPLGDIFVIEDDLSNPVFATGIGTILDEPARVAVQFVRPVSWASAGERLGYKRQWCKSIFDVSQLASDFIFSNDDELKIDINPERFYDTGNSIYRRYNSVFSGHKRM